MVGTPGNFGKRQIWVGVDGTNDNDLLIETEDVSHFDDFSLMSAAGSMDVLVTLDGTVWTTAPLSLADLGATTTDPVIQTSPGRMYAFNGAAYRRIRVLQNGATAVVNPRLTAVRR